MAAAPLSKLVSYDINIPYRQPGKGIGEPTTPYPQYLPTWDPVWFDPLKPFEYHDPALRAAPASRLVGGGRVEAALPTSHGLKGAQLTSIQPKIGTIITGVDLCCLSAEDKDSLARLICERKVVAFPDQFPFIDMGPAKQQEWMNHFGKPHYQPVSGSVKGYPGFHIIHRDGNKDEIDRFMESRTTTTLWHQDVSYEIQPPGYAMLGMLQGPEVGGDTVFAATDEAYKRLSKPMRDFIDGLSVIHSSEKMINSARVTGGLVRKDPVRTIHPLVRRHPVTGEPCIYVNGEFVTNIVGLKDPEQKMLMEFLLQHVTGGHDFQARVKWTPGTIVIFDNRSILHTAVVDYVDEDVGAAPRHIFRLCALGEKPIPNKAEGTSIFA